MGHQVALELRREAHFDVEAAFRPRVRGERAHGEPPHAYRELFRILNALFAGT